MRPTADLVTFNEEIFNRRLHFLCIAVGRVQVEMPSLVAIDIVIVKICYLLVT